jgi:hypothetical protein
MGMERSAETALQRNELQLDWTTFPVRWTFVNVDPKRQRVMAENGSTVVG